MNDTSFKGYKNCALGESISEASLETKYIHTGNLYYTGVTVEDFIDQALHISYASLGAILTRVKEWLLAIVAHAEF